ncbi:MAG: glycosyltransferase [Bacteroidetes bacterium]|nr:glycosyltransferase [Bacteroidota bacterium]
MLDKVLKRIMKYTNWNEYELFILDNDSTPSNKKIINKYLSQYQHIKIISSSFNQIAEIQNQAIREIKSDIYIKVDDDILVSENWTKPFINVYERNWKTMSIGSVIIPINGFSWVPFMEIYGCMKSFKKAFPKEELRQSCTDSAVYKNEKVAEFLWNNCLNVNSSAKRFIKVQNNTYKDIFCPHRYSIGAIIFSHQLWEKMGGWKVDSSYRFKKNIGNSALHLLKKVRRKNDLQRTERSIKSILSLDVSLLGLEEEEVYNYSIENSLSIPITTEGIVFHFSFYPTEQYLMNTVFDKIQF